MKVYEIKHNTLQSHLCWSSFVDAIEELRMHLVEGNVGDSIEVYINEISEDEYKNLKEFEGY